MTTYVIPVPPLDTQTRSTLRKVMAKYKDEIFPDKEPGEVYVDDSIGLSLRMRGNTKEVYTNKFIEWLSASWVRNMWPFSSYIKKNTKTVVEHTQFLGVELICKVGTKE